MKIDEHLSSFKNNANVLAIDKDKPKHMHFIIVGKKIERITIIPTTENIVFVFDAIVKTESTPDDSVLPTTGINDPTAFLILLFKTESEDAARKLCSDIISEKTLINIPITHFMNFLICLSIPTIPTDPEILPDSEKDI